MAGLTQMRVGSVELAINNFRRWAAATPDSAKPYLALAQAHLASGGRDQARQAAQRALELAPESPEAQLAFVDLMSQLGQGREALGFIRRPRASGPRPAWNYALEAAYHGRRNDSPAVVAVLREGVAKTAHPELAGKLYSELVRSGSSAEAEVFAKAWMRQKPDDVAFEFLLSVTDIAAGNNQSAERRLRKVVQTYGNNALALNNLAWVVAQNGTGDPVPFAQRAVDLAPDRPEYLDTLATALAASKQYGAALDAQRRAVDIAPEDDGLRLNLARLALKSGNKSLAREELLRLKALGERFPGQAEVAKLLSQV
jgi:cellulose synthase operon protein C